MAEATYKLARVLVGRTHYAQVTVSAECGGDLKVRVSADAFAWLREEYGPHAWEWSICEAYRAAAVSGAFFAARNIEGQPRYPAVSVVIERIHASVADTSPDDVAYACCWAVWQALGVEGSVSPELLDNSAWQQYVKNPAQQ